ncbi:MAG TPA: hypothetical protein VMU57_19315 [Edaphobacter sp.]|uniref:hypothetical protein n=1 Tax=Edaphobacter sp. TaxID=1934404 RepID=UPI002C96371E|nr:hypothetical protein [Edaphobacter sp.]HUZ97058.1 hypothetical protein [Edaphobacter sp.]
MAIIRVPGPPPEAFRKNRPISDLIKSQIRHFQHLEQKLRLDLPTKFSPHDLTTEDAASRYIAEMTAALRDQSAAAPQTTAPIRVPRPQRRDNTPALRAIPKPLRQPQQIDLAASASAKKPRTKKRAPANSAKKKRP